MEQDQSELHHVEGAGQAAWSGQLLPETSAWAWQQNAAALAVKMMLAWLLTSVLQIVDSSSNVTGQQGQLIYNFAGYKTAVVHQHVSHL